MTQLRVCEGCTRHVFLAETACPFCGAALAQAPRRSFGEKLRSGMSRAQVLAIAAAVTGQTLGACSDTASDDGIPGGSGGSAGDVAGSGGDSGSGEGGAGSGGDSGAGAGGGAGMEGGAGAGAGGMAQPVYGAPVPDSGVDQPVYGAPVPDGGVDDAGDDSGEPMAIPLYGASPPER